MSANQNLVVRRSRIRTVSTWLWTRFLGIGFYGATVAWCAIQMPASLAFVVPGAVVGGYLHVLRGRPWLGLVVFLLIVTVVPMIFWTSMLTGAIGHLTDW